MSLRSIIRDCVSTLTQSRQKRRHSRPQFTAVPAEMQLLEKRDLLAGVMAAAEDQAYALDQQFDFEFAGQYWEDHRGLGEKWIKAETTQDWYYLTPDGGLFNADAPATLVAQFETRFHQNPALLHDAAVPVAQNPEQSAFDLDQRLDLNFTGNYWQNHKGLGEKWIKSVNTSDWYYIVPDGSVIQAKTGDTVVRLTPVFYSSPQKLHDAPDQTPRAADPDQAAYELDMQLDLHAKKSYWQDHLGLNEKWVKSDTEDSWYYIMPNGDVVKHQDQSIVARLTPAFHVDPTLLHEAYISSTTGNATSVSMVNLLSTPPTPAQASTAPHTRRPTLVVLTQGAHIGETAYKTYAWQKHVAFEATKILDAADSQTHVMYVQWDSMSPNTDATSQVAGRIEKFLAARANRWDVLMVGHSRGAIFNHEMSSRLADHDKVVHLQHIMIDPTASISMGDNYPQTVDRDVDRAVVYDDGYKFLPLGLVKDGLAVQNAEYKRVTVDGVVYYDTINSHSKIGGWYATNHLKDDIGWLLERNPAAATAEYADEALGNENEFIVASSKDPRGEMGLDFADGNMHGYVSILAIGGVDVTIGKSGVNASGGVTFLGAAGMSITENGLTMHISNPVGIPANIGTQIGIHESRQDHNVAGLDFGWRIGGSNGGRIFVGDQEVTWSGLESATSKAWKVTEKRGGQIIESAIVDGKTLGQEIRNNAGQLLSQKFWNDRGQLNVSGVLNGTEWVYRRYDDAGSLTSFVTFFDGLATKPKDIQTWANGKLTNSESYTSAGWKRYGGWLASNGKWVINELNAAGKTVASWVYFGESGSQLEEWKTFANGQITNYASYASNGVTQVRSWLTDRGQWFSNQMDSAGDVVRQLVYHGPAGSGLQEVTNWANGKRRSIESFTTNGVRTLHGYFSTTGNWVERHYSNGNQTALRIWDASGKYLGDQMQNLRDQASNLDPTSKPWWPF